MGRVLVQDTLMDVCRSPSKNNSHENIKETKPRTTQRYITLHAHVRVYTSIYEIPKSKKSSKNEAFNYSWYVLLAISLSLSLAYSPTSRHYLSLPLSLSLCLTHSTTTYLSLSPPSPDSFSQTFTPSHTLSPSL